MSAILNRTPFLRTLQLPREFVRSFLLELPLLLGIESTFSFFSYGCLQLCLRSFERFDLEILGAVVAVPNYHGRLAGCHNVLRFCRSSSRLSGDVNTSKFHPESVEDEEDKEEDLKLGAGFELDRQEGLDDKGNCDHNRGGPDPQHTRMIEELYDSI